MYCCMLQYSAIFAIYCCILLYTSVYCCILLYTAHTVLFYLKPHSERDDDCVTLRPVNAVLWKTSQRSSCLRPEAVIVEDGLQLNRSQLCVQLWCSADSVDSGRRTAVPGYDRTPFCVHVVKTTWKEVKKCQSRVSWYREAYKVM